MKTRARKTLIYPILVLLLTLLLGLCAFGLIGKPVANAQADTEEPTDLTYLLNEDSQSYSVRILDKSLKSITIPATYNNFPVTGIDDGGFTGCTALEKIVIPSSVKSIGNNAFMRCTNLKKVLGMSGVTSFGSNAFSMCSKLEYLILPSGLTNVGTNMLRSVKADVYSRTLENDLLGLNPDCLSSFSGNTIYGNELVYESYVDPLTSEEGLSLVSWQNLDLYADGFPEDTTLEISSWIENIPGSGPNEGKLLNIAPFAFAAYNEYGSTVECNAENIIIRNAEGYSHPINIQSYAFAQSNVKNISIEVDFTLNDPDDGTSYGVFYESNALESVTFSKSLDAIPHEMFSDCKVLKEIKFGDTDTNYLPSSVKRIEAKAFSNCISMSELYITENIEFIGQNAFYRWGSNKDVYQNIYINLEKPEDNWNQSWDTGIVESNCNVEFIGNTQLSINFVVEQNGVVQPSIIKSITAERNDTLNDLNIAIPISKSHDFDGNWYTTESRSEGTEFAWDKPIKSDLTLYAGWSIKNLTITIGSVKCCSFYEFPSKKCLDSQEVQLEYGKTLSFYITTKEGYKNYRVYNNNKLLEPIEGYIYNLEVIEDCNITAKADLIDYTITFDEASLRKGYNPNGKEIKYTVESDTITFKNPTWDAYANGEWNIPSITKGTTGDKLIKAKWSNPKSFDITFDLAGDPNGSHTNGNNLTYTVEQVVNISAPTSPGYEEGQWKIKYTNTIISNGWSQDTYWRDITLVADWSGPNKYSISFNLNGGTGNSTSVMVEYGDYLPAKAKPTLSRHAFRGYYYNKVKYYDENMDSVRQWYNPNDGTLTAAWEQVKFTITFQQKNGTGIGGPATLTIDKEKGDLLPSKISIPTRKGYYIKGFYDQYQIESHKVYNADGTFNSQNLSTGRSVTRDMTLFCYWEIEDYYYFLIDQKHGMAAAPSKTLSTLTLPYDGVIEYTAEETLTYTELSQDGKNIVSQDTRGFSRWVMNLNGPNEFDATTNPWHILTTDRALSISVATIIEKYYPNYLDDVPPKTIYVRAIFNEPISGCVADGTMITLADGSKKAVEELTGNEMLLVWNLNTGTFDVAPILFIDHDPAQLSEIIKLRFSDNTEVKVIYEHGFWDCDLNSYVYMRNDAAQYIGHWFSKQMLDENGNLTWTRVQLLDVEITEEYTSSWSPVTYGHLCYYVNDMLSMPGGIEGLFNIFKVCDDMKFDAIAMENDIQTYGLFTYEEFAELVLVPEEMFDAVSGQYLKVAIGKGLITIEEIQKLVNRYSVFFE